MELESSPTDDDFYSSIQWTQVENSHQPQHNINSAPQGSGVHGGQATPALDINLHDQEPRIAQPLAPPVTQHAPHTGDCCEEDDFEEAEWEQAMVYAQRVSQLAKFACASAPANLRQLSPGANRSTAAASPSARPSPARALLLSPSSRRAPRAVPRPQQHLAGDTQEASGHSTGQPAGLPTTILAEQTPTWPEPLTSHPAPQLQPFSRSIHGPEPPGDTHTPAQSGWQPPAAGCATLFATASLFDDNSIQESWQEREGPDAPGVQAQQAVGSTAQGEPARQDHHQPAQLFPTTNLGRTHLSQTQQAHASAPPTARQCDIPASQHVLLRPPVAPGIDVASSSQASLPKRGITQLSSLMQHPFQMRQAPSLQPLPDAGETQPVWGAPPRQAAVGSQPCGTCPSQPPSQHYSWQAQQPDANQFIPRHHHHHQQQQQRHSWSQGGGAPSCVAHDPSRAFTSADHVPPVSRGSSWPQATVHAPSDPGVHLSTSNAHPGHQPARQSMSDTVMMDSRPPHPPAPHTLQTCTAAPVAHHTLPLVSLAPLQPGGRTSGGRASGGGASGGDSGGGGGNSSGGAGQVRCPLPAPLIKPPAPPRKEYKGRKPFASCPGVYAACGGALRWVKPPRSDMGCWCCSRYPDCGYVHWSYPAVPHPQVTLEIATPNTFKVLPQPGADDSVQEAGGVAAVLKQAGVNMASMICDGGSSPAQDSQQPCQGALPDGTTAAPPSTAPAPGPPVVGSTGNEAEQPLDSCTFPLDCYEEVLRVLQARKRNLLGPGSPIPPPTLKSYRGGFKALTDESEVAHRLSRMPAALRDALMPFQLEGVRYGLSHHGRVLIADEMGVGKTVQAMALASCYQEEWPLLAIVPASMRLVWAEELEKWMPHISPSQIHVIEGKAQRFQAAAESAPGQAAAQKLPLITITSYEMMRRLSCDSCCSGSVVGSGGFSDTRRLPCQSPATCMASLPWGMVIIDESHNMRTCNSRLAEAPHTEACCNAVRRARRAVMLTGTPSLTRPYDLFRQVDTLCPALLGRNKEEFSERYCERRLVPVTAAGGKEGKKRWFNSGGSHLYELHGLLKREVMIRRLKREVLGQLPPKRRSVIRLPLPAANRWPGGKETLDDADDDSEQEEAQAGGAAAGADVDAAEKPTGKQTNPSRMSRDHRTALAKLPDVLDWLLGALDGSAGLPGDAGDADGPAKFLVFAHHRDVMDALAAELLTCKRPGGDGGGSGVSKAGGGESGGKEHQDRIGVSFVRVDGSHTSEERREAVRQFRDDSSVRVALLSITAAGVGLDFSSASVVVFVELPTEVALVRQAEDRAHRKGATKAVNVYFLVAKGTCDDSRWQRLNNSLMTINQVQDGAPTEQDDALNAPGSIGSGLGSSTGGMGSGQAAAAVPRGLQVHQVLDMQPTAQNALSRGAASSGAATALLTEAVAAAVPTASGTEPVQGVDVSKVVDDGVAMSSGADVGATAAAEGCDVVLGSGGHQGSPPRASTPADSCVIDLCSPAPPGERACQVADQQEAAQNLPGSCLVPAKKRKLLSDSNRLGSMSLSEGREVEHRLTETVKRLRVSSADGSSAPGVTGVRGSKAGGGGGGGSGPVPAWGHAAARHGKLKHLEEQAGQEVTARGAGADAGGVQGTASRHENHTHPELALAVGQCDTSAAGAVQTAATSAGDGTGVPAGLPAGVPEQPVSFWFEVSGNTNRILFHLAVDGSRPLGLNLPIETLVSPASLQAFTDHLITGYRKVMHSIVPMAEPILRSLTAFIKAPTVEPPAVPPQTQPGSQQQQVVVVPVAGIGAASQQVPGHYLSQPVQTRPNSAGLSQHTQGANGSQSQQPLVEVMQRTAQDSMHSTLSVPDFQGSLKVAAVLAAHTPGFLTPVGMVAISPLISYRQLPAGSAQPPGTDDTDETAQPSRAAPQEALPLIGTEPAQPGDLPRGPCVPEPDASQPAMPDAALPCPPSDLPSTDRVPDSNPTADAAQLDALGLACEPAAQPLPTSSGAVEAGGSAAAAATQGVEAAAGQEHALAAWPLNGASVSADGDQTASSVQPAVHPSQLVVQPLSEGQLREVLHEAAQFAREWRELRAITRARLQNKVLTTSLQDAVDVANAEALASGAFGSSTARTIKEAGLVLPPGAEWRTVMVRVRPGAAINRVQPGVHSNVVAVHEYQQAFMCDSQERLCLMCGKAVPGAPPPDAVLRSVSGLFCCPLCEDRYWLKASNGAIRRSLSKLERGVCTQCGMDCRSVVLALSSIRHGSTDWAARRKALLQARWPKMLQQGYMTLGNKLMEQAIEGNAWHADHIIPVYKGGGLCELDNLRTLCVACHADVTKAQARERKEERQRDRLGVKDIRAYMSQTTGNDSVTDKAAAKKPPKGGPRKKKGGYAAAGASVPPPATVLGVKMQDEAGNAAGLVERGLEVPGGGAQAPGGKKRGRLAELLECSRGQKEKAVKKPKTSKAAGAVPRAGTSKRKADGEHMMLQAVLHKSAAAAAALPDDVKLISTLVGAVSEVPTAQRLKAALQRPSTSGVSGSSSMMVGAGPSASGPAVTSGAAGARDLALVEAAGARAVEVVSVYSSDDDTEGRSRAAGPRSQGFAAAQDPLHDPALDGTRQEPDVEAVAAQGDPGATDDWDAAQPGALQHLVLTLLSDDD